MMHSRDFLKTTVLLLTRQHPTVLTPHDPSSPHRAAPARPKRSDWTLFSPVLVKAAHCRPAFSPTPKPRNSSCSPFPPHGHVATKRDNVGARSRGASASSRAGDQRPACAGGDEGLDEELRESHLLKQGGLCEKAERELTPAGVSTKRRSLPSWCFSAVRGRLGLANTVWHTPRGPLVRRETADTEMGRLDPRWLEGL